MRISNQVKIKKSDLKNGAIVQLRNGDKLMLIDDMLLDIIDLGDWRPFVMYDEDLLCTEDMFYDVVKVNNLQGSIAENASVSLRQVINEDRWTWERKEPLTDFEKDRIHTMLCQIDTVKEELSEVKTFKTTNRANRFIEYIDGEIDRLRKLIDALSVEDEKDDEY